MSGGDKKGSLSQSGNSNGGKNRVSGAKGKKGSGKAKGNAVPREQESVSRVGNKGKGKQNSVIGWGGNGATMKERRSEAADRVSGATSDRNTWPTNAFSARDTRTTVPGNIDERNTVSAGWNFNTSSNTPGARERTSLRKQLAFLDIEKVSFDEMVGMIKSCQRVDIEMRTAWVHYTNVERKGIRDPEKHDDAFLREFFRGIQDGSMEKYRRMKNPHRGEEANEVFVGGTGVIATDRVEAYFQNFGELRYCDMKKDKGFGFVKFDSRAVMERVLAKSEHIIEGKRVEVKAAENRAPKKKEASVHSVGGELGEQTSKRASSGMGDASSKEFYPGMNENNYWKGDWKVNYGYDNSYNNGYNNTFVNSAMGYNNTFFNSAAHFAGSPVMMPMMPTGMPAAMAQGVPTMGFPMMVMDQSGAPMNMMMVAAAGGMPMMQPGVTTSSLTSTQKTAGMEAASSPAGEAGRPAPGDFVPGAKSHVRVSPTGSRVFQ